MNTSLIQGLIDWQCTRNLNSMPYTHTNEIKNIIEECVEASGFLSSIQARDVATNIVDTYILNDYNDSYVAVDSYCDIINFAIGAILKLGFNPEIALQECLKELNDRTGSYNHVLGKWRKEPPKPNAYKADYSKALL